MLANGDIPFSFQPWFAGVTLIAIPKSPSEKRRLRPIAIGVLFRCFVARLLTAHLSSNEDFTSYLWPLLHAVGSKHGIGSIIHGIWLTCDALSDSDHVLLKLDLTNAFNRVERSHLLREVIIHTPQVARYAHLLYSHQSHLLFVPFLVSSRTGTHQGDPLAMHLYALSIHPFLIRLRESIPTAPPKTWYADDGNIVKQQDSAASLLRQIETEGPDYGISITLQKTEAWWSTPPQQAALLCTVNKSSAITTLGSPVGHHDGCRAIIGIRLHQQRKLWDALKSLRDPQMAFHLLHHCDCASRMTHALRTTLPQITLSTSKLFDIELRGSFEAIHRDPHDDAWLCASLSFSLGGLGLTLKATVSSLSNYNSLLSTFPLVCVSLHLPLDDASRQPSSPLMPTSPPNSISPPLFNCPMSSHPSSDRALSLVHNLCCRPSAMSLASSRTSPVPPESNLLPNLARDLTCRTQSLHLSFTELPDSRSCTTVEPEMWNMMVQIRLGNPVLAGTEPCPRCVHSRSDPSPLLDRLGVHATSCPSLEGYVRRHNHIRDNLISILRHPTTGLRAKKEYTFPCQDHLPANERLRMDILIDDLALSPRPQAIDIFIVSPYTSRALPASTKHPRGATTGIEALKNRSIWRPV